MTRVTDLIFTQHPNEFLLIERAEAQLDNGIVVSVIQGPHVWRRWQPGWYEATVIDPSDEDGNIVRGNAAGIDAWLARLAALPAVKL